MSPKYINEPIQDCCLACTERSVDAGVRNGLIYCREGSIWVRTYPFCEKCIDAKRELETRKARTL